MCAAVADPQGRTPTTPTAQRAAPRRLGLFGGSFNPVHWGHLLVAQTAREELGLDRLVFIPAAQSPFKPGLALAPAGIRLQLLRLALAGLDWTEVDDLELRRGGVSYTITTVREIAARFPSAELFFLIGADHLSQLPRWREATELAQCVQFVVIPRPGAPEAPLPTAFRLTPLSGFPLAVSSSQIRARVRAGLSIDLLVPTAVAEAIHNNRLYL